VYAYQNLLIGKKKAERKGQGNKQLLRWGIKRQRKKRGRQKEEKKKGKGRRGAG